MINKNKCSICRHESCQNKTSLDDNRCALESCGADHNCSVDFNLCINCIRDLQKKDPESIEELYKLLMSWKNRVIELPTKKGEYLVAYYKDQFVDDYEVAKWDGRDFKAWREGSCCDPMKLEVISPEVYAWMTIPSLKIEEVDPNKPRED